MVWLRSSAYRVRFRLLLQDPRVKSPSVQLRRIALILPLVVLLCACNPILQLSILHRKTATPEQLSVKIVAVWPHDPASFTEGLLWHNGFLYESSGLYGRSNLRKVDPQSGAVRQQVEDPARVFGEGIAIDGNQLYQLTWREHAGYVYDLDTLTEVGTFSYQGEGWGLCFDDHHFYMSNGSASISIRDPRTFALIGHIEVRQNAQPIAMLNELECVGDSIYANVWMTNHILRINKSSGLVTGVIDAGGLLTSQELAQAGPNGVLNGVAYNPTRNDFLITGKFWPKLFEVRFVPTRVR
jgi:glutamine cyclotransferase